MATYRSKRNAGGESERFLVRTANVVRLVYAEDDFKGAKERMLEAAGRGNTWTQAFF